MFLLYFLSADLQDERLSFRRVSLEWLAGCFGYLDLPAGALRNPHYFQRHPERHRRSL